MYFASSSESSGASTFKLVCQNFMFSVYHIIRYDYYEVHHIPNVETGNIDKITKWTGGRPGFSEIPEKCVYIKC